jgi:hypothetical protein
MIRLLTSEAIAWNREHAAMWEARADERRAAGGVLNTNIAAALHLVVRDMRAAIAAATLAAPVERDIVGEVEQLEAQLAAWQPGTYPGTDIMVRVGPISDGVRHDIRCKIAALTGEALPAEPVIAIPPVIVPPAEAMPFTAGPQLDLFGIAA